MPKSRLGRREGILVLGAVTAMAILATLTIWKPGESGKRGERTAVPVVVVAAHRADVLHEVASIGTVQSQQTVTLRPQVTGILTEVVFTEGQLVRKGQLLARIDDRGLRANLARAEAEKASRLAQLHSAQRDLDRFLALDDPRVISRQQIDQQSALVEQLAAGIRASDAAIDALRVQVEYTRIVSPLAGRVGIRRVDPGNLVEAGDLQGIVTVTQVDPISVVFSLPQTAFGATLAALRDGVSRQVVAFDRDAGDRLAVGRLASVDNQVDAATGTLRARAEFPNSAGLLWPGQFVALQVQTGEDNDAIVIPSRAVNEGISGSFVYRVRDAKAVAVPVKVGYRNIGEAVISAGVEVGDLVVVDGQSRLTDGTTVEASLAERSVASR